MSTRSPIPMPITEEARRRLEEARRQLLGLHKVLLESEKSSYESAHGAINGAAHLLNLLMSDPYFDWLHRISELIVQMDELLENEEGSLEDVSELMAQGRRLLSATGEETEFIRRYKMVLQKDSAAVLAHAQVQKALLPEG